MQTSNMIQQMLASHPKQSWLEPSKLARSRTQIDTDPQRSVVKHMVEACAAVCQACGEECARHAQMHEHCRICAESCWHCEDVCRQVLSNM